MRTANGALTPLFSLRTLDTVDELSPRQLAKVACEIPQPGKTSSRKISPGRVGLRLESLLLRINLATNEYDLSLND